MNNYVERLTLIAGPRPDHLAQRHATADCMDLHNVLDELEQLRALRDAYGSVGAAMVGGPDA